MRYNKLKFLFKNQKSITIFDNNIDQKNNLESRSRSQKSDLQSDPDHDWEIGQKVIGNQIKSDWPITI